MSDEIPILTKKDNADSLMVSSLQNIEEILKETNSVQEYEKVNKALERFEDKTEKKDKKKEKKEKKKDSEFIKSLKEAGQGLKENASKTLFDTFLGPLRLITEPLEQFGNFKFQDIFSNLFKKKEKEDRGEREKPFSAPMENITEGLTDTLFEKKEDKEDEKFSGKPNRQKVLPLDPGSVLLFDLLSGKKGGETEDQGLSSMLDGLLGPGGIGGAASSILPMLAKAGGIAMIVGGLIWAVMDGIAGFTKADEWGTSKVSGVIGAVLGGTGSGLENGFKNMGKFALIGAGIGTLFAPGLGTIIGGLIGAGVGFLLGWIGGENIAKFFDGIANAIGTFFTKTIPEFAGFIWDTISGFFIGIWDKFFAGFFEDILGAWDKNFGEASKKSKKNFAQKILSFLFSIPQAIGNYIYNFIDNIFDVLESIPIIGEAYKWIDETIFSPIKGIFNSFYNGIQSFIEDPGKWIQDVWNNVTTSVSNFFKNTGKAIGDFAKDPMGSISNIVNWLVEGLQNFFKPIGDFFEFVGERGMDIIPDLIGGGFEGQMKAFQEKKSLTKMGRQFALSEQGLGKTEAELDAEIQRKSQELIKAGGYRGLFGDDIGRALKDATNEVLTKYAKMINDRPNYVQNTFGDSYSADASLKKQPVKLTD